jgi:hypothetical protein
MDRILATTGVVVALIVTGTTSCSALGGSPQTAGTGTSTSAPTARRSSSNAEIYHRAAECIRAHGAPNFPEPTQNPQTGKWGVPPGTRKPPRSAATACRSILSQIPEAKGDGEREQRPLTAAEMAKGKQFAQCMRQHGLADWPDPNATGEFVLPGRYERLGKRGLLSQLNACRTYNIQGRFHLTIQEPSQ